MKKPKGISIILDETNFEHINSKINLYVHHKNQATGLLSKRSTIKIQVEKLDRSIQHDLSDPSLNKNSDYIVCKSQSCRIKLDITIKQNTIDHKQAEIKKNTFFKMITL